MGWVTLTLRKLTLRAEINNLELRDLQLSRELRRVHREKSYEQSVYNRAKKEELAAAKSALDNIRNSKSSDWEYGSNEYKQWQEQYALAKEDYEGQKLDINNYYDDLQNEMEEETTDKETEIQDEQTEIEAQLQAMRAELETVNDQIGSDVKDQAIKLS